MCIDVMGCHDHQANDSPLADSALSEGVRMAVQPFEINVPEETLTDLQERLSRTRWPDEIYESEWDYGTNLAYMKELVDYWLYDFDWRAQERLINSFKHYRTQVDGLGIHFIHEIGRGPNPIPLVMTHGWPGSFFEMHKIIPLLTNPESHGGDPADSFDVVVPSMPGYGFSDAVHERGMHAFKVSDLWAKLMTEELGYARFGAQGGDWGGNVTAYLGFAYPEQLIGIHLTALHSPSPYLGPGSRALSDQEKELQEAKARWSQAESGYSRIQGTRPQTLSYGMNDSPAGTAAWLVEKYRSWSDCDGDIESKYTKDELLTTVMIYWVTQTFNSAARLYYETQNNNWEMKKGEMVQTPVGIASFPKEINPPPREWAERSFKNILRWTDMPSGGHFSALEEPELLAEDIRGFFQGLRG